LDTRPAVAPQIMTWTFFHKPLFLPLHAYINTGTLQNDWWREFVREFHSISHRVTTQSFWGNSFAFPLNF
jgi:hypothetical protein